ncbi:MAG TPA: winged helix-turn-helix domain-containing protein [Steroidobacteraceae bacterium]|nr:winged helix-turn-helix domain-containing protein [Steroidobacteraceae bacterium]
MDSLSFRCGEVELDVPNRRFRRGGTEVALEPKVFSAIVQLVSRAGELVTRNQLLDAIWGHRYVSASTVNRLIVLARRAFADDPDEPRFIRTVHGVGYRYDGPVARLDATGLERVAPFAPPAIARLPARIDSLIGRDGELASLCGLLSENRAVSVIGPGGIGKTQFSLEAARRLMPQFPDGVWFFDLAPVKGGEEWLHSLAAAVSVSSEQRTELIKRVCQVFQARHALILLDNCDRIAEQVGSIVIEILLATDHVRILATTQVALNFRGERLLRLPPLGIPESPEDTADLARLARVPAVEMLLARIHASQRAFELTSANAAAIADICRRLDGLPLALELAAARFDLLAPDQVLERLDHRFRFLKSEMSGRDPRHRTLLALLDWSFALLSNEERRVLCWCAIFVQGWTVQSAVALAPPLGIDPEAVLELLGGLANKSLVSVKSNLAPPRYQLLESVRDYALEQLRAAQELSLAQAAHLTVMVQMSHSVHADMIGGRMAERIETMLPEKGNVGAALEYALVANNLDAALAIVGNLTVYSKATGVFELLPLFRRVIDATAALQTPDRGRALLCVGVLTFFRQSPEALAGQCLREAARIASMHGDTWAQAYAAGFCALWLVNEFQQEDAQMQAAVVQRVADQSRDPLLLGLAGLARGWVHLARGENAAAIEVLRSVRSLGEDAHQQHFIDMYFGLALFRSGKPAGAAAQWLAGMKQAARVGHLRGIAGSVEGCAYLAEKRAEPGKAARFLAVAETVRERMKIPLFKFWRPHHAEVETSLRSTLGPGQYELVVQQARRAREEDIFDEVRAVLEQYAQEGNGAAAPSSAIDARGAE